MAARSHSIGLTWAIVGTFIATVLLLLLVLFIVVPTQTDSFLTRTLWERGQAIARFWRPVGATTTGSGLGLAIVDHLALASGGQLSLEAGQGATGLRVVIDLPRRPSAS